MTDTPIVAHPIDGHETILVAIKDLADKLDLIQAKLNAVAIACKCE